MADRSSSGPRQDQPSNIGESLNGLLEGRRPEEALSASQLRELLLGYPWPYTSRPPHFGLSTRRDWIIAVPDRRQERNERKRAQIAELNKRATETELRLKRLYDAIENGIADVNDPDLKDRIRRPRLPAINHGSVLSTPPTHMAMATENP